MGFNVTKKNIHTYGVDVKGTKMLFDAYKLIQTAPFETFQVKTADLKDSLYEKIWTDDNKKEIRPIDVIDDINKELYNNHRKRIEKADLSYPIILNPDGNIADGMHRLCYVVLNNIETVNCCQFKKWSDMKSALYEK